MDFHYNLFSLTYFPIIFILAVKCKNAQFANPSSSFVIVRVFLDHVSVNQLIWNSYFIFLATVVCNDFYTFHANHALEKYYEVTTFRECSHFNWYHGYCKMTLSWHLVFQYINGYCSTNISLRWWCIEIISTSDTIILNRRIVK